MHRDKVASDRGDASTDVAARRPPGSSIPGPPTSYTQAHTGEGSMGKAVKLTTKPQGLPIHPDWEGHKKSLPFTKNEPTRGPSRRLATSSSLHARSMTPRDHARPSSSPETLKGEKGRRSTAGGRGRREEEEREGEGVAGQRLKPPTPRTRRTALSH
ncbi:hypothetical protein Taro_005675 [Colocasia esculenta]|uniref:Uncharacterized protein n=1 Tax=Colocasia esculenta TaxID=4460 RepID=A0A843TT32_COLES|nr:hypothetical protein [Colocasia esculenta]